jgi:hypothetical protein
MLQKGGEPTIRYCMSDDDFAPIAVIRPSLAHRQRAALTHSFG